MPYNRAKIRQFISNALNDEDLSVICHDHFIEVFGQFASGQTKGQRVMLLMEHVHRRDNMKLLLQELENINPKAYAENKDEFVTDLPIEASNIGDQLESKASEDDPVGKFESLLDERNEPQIRRILLAESQKMRAELDSIDSLDHAVKRGGFDSEQYKDAVNQWESPGKTMRELFAAFCYSGQLPFSPAMIGYIKNVSDPGDSLVPSSVWLGLKLYPALLLVYAGGIAALAGGHDGLLGGLLTHPRVMNLAADFSRDPKPLILVVNQNRVFGDWQSWLPEAQHNMMPASARMHNVLRNGLETYLPNEADYKRSFDRFEYLASLVYADLFDKEMKKRLDANHFIGDFLMGSYLYDHYSFQTAYPAQLPPVVQEMREEITTAGQNSPLLQAGLFDGSVDRLQMVMQELDERILEWIRRARGNR